MKAKKKEAAPEVIFEYNDGAKVLVNDGERKYEAEICSRKNVGGEALYWVKPFQQEIPYSYVREEQIDREL